MKQKPVVAVGVVARRRIKLASTELSEREREGRVRGTC